MRLSELVFEIPLIDYSDASRSLLKGGSWFRYNCVRICY